jgi:hypothetical protein
MRQSCRQGVHLKCVFSGRRRAEHANGACSGGGELSGPDAKRTGDCPYLQYPHARSAQKIQKSVCVVCVCVRVCVCVCECVCACVQRSA